MLLNCGAGKHSWESLEQQKKSNQSILKEINPEYPLEGLMLKLKLQYFGHLRRTADSLEKILMLGNIWRQKEKRVTEDEMVGWHHGFIGYEFGKLQETVRDREAWRAVVHGVANGRTRLRNWTTTTVMDNDVESVFMCLCDISLSTLRKFSLYLDLFSNWSVFLLLSFESFFCILLFQISDLQIFSPIL